MFFFTHKNPIIRKGRNIFEDSSPVLFLQHLNNFQIHEVNIPPSKEKLEYTSIHTIFKNKIIYAKFLEHFFLKQFFIQWSQLHCAERQIESLQLHEFRSQSYSEVEQ